MLIDYHNEPDDTLVPRALARRMLGGVSNDTMRRLEHSGRLPPRYLSTEPTKQSRVFYRLGVSTGTELSPIMGFQISLVAGFWLFR
jgi:hypothetical protein